MKKGEKYEARGKEIGKVIGAIETYQEFGKSKEETFEKVMNKFQLSREEAEEIVENYWKMV